MDQGPRTTDNRPVGAVRDLRAVREPPLLCETCLERGRRRLGVHPVGNGWMCDPCFGGEGTRAEHLGENFQPARLANARAARHYYMEHREELIKKAQTWRRKHAGEIRARRRRWRKKLRAIEKGLGTRD